MFIFQNIYVNILRFNNKMTFNYMLKIKTSNKFSVVNLIFYFFFFVLKLEYDALCNF